MAGTGDLGACGTYGHGVLKCLNCLHIDAENKVAKRVKFERVF